MFMYQKGNAYSTTMDNRDVALKSQFDEKFMMRVGILLKITL